MDIGKEGIIPHQMIHEMIHEEMISGFHTISQKQIQPASLDLRLGMLGYKMQASCIPLVGEPVGKKIDKYCEYQIDLVGNGTILEKGNVYLIELIETLELPAKISGVANAKSSAGRCDILARLVLDGVNQFDKIPNGYRGKMWLEVAPRSFSIRVRTGTKLNQIRFQLGDVPVSDKKIVTADLSEKFGLKAKKNRKYIDFDAAGKYAAADFWDVIKNQDILDLDEFYLVGSKENIVIPDDMSAEMVAYDVRYGEFRSHFAGFFDGGFGTKKPSRAVMEIRTHEVPFVLEDGQPLGELHYQKMAEVPDISYSSIGYYEGQQTKYFSKHFYS